MTERSLTQQEAQERAALLEVERYDIDVDLTDLPTGPRCGASRRSPSRCREAGAGTFVDCAAEVVSADAQRGAAAARRGRPHPAAGPAGAQRARRR